MSALSSCQDKSLMSVGSSQSVDFKTAKVICGTEAKKLEEVKEDMDDIEESAKRVQEEEDEDEFFDELPEDMIDEGVSAKNMK